MVPVVNSVNILLIAGVVDDVAAAEIYVNCGGAVDLGEEELLLLAVYICQCGVDGVAVVVARRIYLPNISLKFVICRRIKFLLKGTKKLLKMLDW